MTARRAARRPSPTGRSTPSSSASPTCRAASRASGSSAHHFLEEVVAHGAEACNYLLAVDVDMNTVDGLRDVLVGDRLRRLRDEAGLRHAAARAVARGHGDVHGRPPVARATSRSSPRRARSCAASSTASPSAAGRRSRPPSSSSSSSATPTSRRCTSATTGLEPANLYNVDYSMLGTSRLEPLIGRIRREMAGRRAARWRTPRASATSASTRSTSPTRARCDAADTHTIYKNGAKEIAAQEGMAITFMAKYDEREGNSCHIHLSVRGGGRHAGVRRAARAVRPLRRRPARLPARADAVQGAERQLLQALRRGLVRPDRGRLGPRQPHVLDARDRPRPRRCASRTGSRAATSTRTWRSRR